MCPLPSPHPIPPTFFACYCRIFKLGFHSIISHLFVCFVCLWHRGVVVITTAKLHSTKPELRFCEGSNSASGMSDSRWWESLTMVLARNKPKCLPCRQSTIGTTKTIHQWKYFFFLPYPHFKKNFFEKYSSLFLESSFLSLLGNSIVSWLLLTSKLPRYQLALDIVS